MRLLTVLAIPVLAAGLALADDRPAKDWTAQMGDVPFVVGLEKGREEVKFTGRPAMLFFTSSKDEWCPKFAARTWKDKQVIADISGYTPVLIDADTAPKELKDKHMVAIVPAVVWLDFDESQVFTVVGDADLNIFRMAGSGVAKDRCPDPHPPAEGYAALVEAKKRLDAAVAAKDVKAELAAIADVRKVGVGAALQKAAAAADVRLRKDGEAEVARARALIAAKKTPDAKKALERVLADYGADHPVGMSAQQALDELAGKKKPAK